MRNRRYQTTFTFRDEARARRFVAWLERYALINECGNPRFVDLRDVGGRDPAWCVEYSADSEFVNGLAQGIDLP